MVKETVESIANQVADGTMDATEAGRRIRGLVTRIAPARTEAERMARYYESHHELAIETDPNSFMFVNVLYYAGKITKAQRDAIQSGMD